MKQINDILAQEPQMEPVQEQNLGEVKGYIAYLNLDWLDIIFAQEGWLDDMQRQEEFYQLVAGRAGQRGAATEEKHDDVLFVVRQRETVAPRHRVNARVGCRSGVADRHARRERL